MKHITEVVKWVKMMLTGGIRHWWKPWQVKHWGKLGSRCWREPERAKHWGCWRNRGWASYWRIPTGAKHWWSVVNHTEKRYVNFVAKKKTLLLMDIKQLRKSSTHKKFCLNSSSLWLRLEIVQVQIPHIDGGWGDFCKQRIKNWLCINVFFYSAIFIYYYNIINFEPLFIYCLNALNEICLICTLWDNREMLYSLENKIYKYHNPR